MHARCFAHTFNLASQQALKFPGLSKLLARTRRFVSFAHHSTVGTYQLERQKLLGLPCHKLITDVSPRWNSTYETVDRSLEQQAAICATLLSPQVRKGEADLCTLTKTDVSNAEDAVKAMNDATTLKSEESSPSVFDCPTASSTVPGNDGQHCRIINYL